VSGRVKKRRDKLARMALEGSISVPEAQRRAGGKYARKAAQADLVKAQQARAQQRAQAAQLTGIVKETIADLLKTGQPVTQDTVNAARELGTGAGIIKAAGAEHWTGTQQALLVKAATATDPAAREAAYQALVDQGLRPGVPTPPAARKSVHALVRVPGPDGVVRWQQMREPERPGPGLGYGIAGR
jgi:hypothetical protein